MKNPIILMALIALVVGTAGGVVGGLLTGSDGTSSLEIPTPAPPNPFASSDVLRDLAALREESIALRDRVTALENRPDPVVTSSFGLKQAREEVNALAKRIDALTEARSQQTKDGLIVDEDGAAMTPQFTSAVEKTVQSMRRREVASKWRAGVQFEKERRDDRLSELQSTLNLNDRQVSDLRAAFSDQDARSLEFIRMWEEGGTSEELIGQAKSENHRVHQQALANIFTPAQFEQFQSIQGGPGKK